MAHSSSLIETHLRRQAKLVYPILLKALDESEDKLSVEDVATSIEAMTWRYELEIFQEKSGNSDLDSNNSKCATANAGHNFYPPFLNRQLLATYHLFFTHVPVPFSCKANRGQTEEEEEFFNQKILPQLPSLTPSTVVNDALGNRVTTIHDLESDNAKLPFLKGDSHRIRHVKECVEEMNSFCYPAVSLPPALMMLIQEVLLTGKALPIRGSKVSEKDDADISVTDDDVSEQDSSESAEDDTDIVRKHLKNETFSETTLNDIKVRLSLSLLVDLGCRALDMFLTDRRIVRATHEGLHYLFNHGYIRLISKLANLDLSSYATYGGLTHHNKLSHGGTHRALPNDLQKDYVLDQIYVYLLYNWQTFLSLWHQSLDESTLTAIKFALVNQRGEIYAQSTVREMTNKILNVVFPNSMLNAVVEGLPNMCTQSQLQNFRVFILERSGIPQVIPSLLQDFIPISLSECPLYLWSHCQLLRQAAFILNQGDYLNDALGQPGASVLSSKACNCNLCSPFKIPAQNKALAQEISLVGQLNVDKPGGPEGQSQPHLRLTGPIFIESYLRPCAHETFFHDRILFYNDNPDLFPHPECGFVITDVDLLDRLCRTKKAQEVKLLHKGGGRYLDPETGDDLMLRNPTIASSIVQSFAERQVDEIEDSDESAEKEREEFLALKSKHARLRKGDPESRRKSLLSLTELSPPPLPRRGSKHVWGCASSGQSACHIAPTGTGPTGTFVRGGGRRKSERGGRGGGRKFSDSRRRRNDNGSVTATETTPTRLIVAVEQHFPNSNSIDDVGYDTPDAISPPSLEEKQTTAATKISIDDDDNGTTNSEASSTSKTPPLNVAPSNNTSSLVARR